ncbi:hypothetical protein AVEN_9710-1 [Araneus ventricosus]|uniref:Uncharacterized protein n=1 Tax=Araneus ventricosus TaxID=182803 RepID=A0A4Y2DZE5_ARAVE|nr:hypothetical protein AVEN_9710-1 [Araneus ventricosus]
MRAVKNRLGGSNLVSDSGAPKKSCVISSDLKSCINSDLGSKHREIGNFLNSRFIKLRALLVVSYVTLIGGNYPALMNYFLYGLRLHCTLTS